MGLPLKTTASVGAVVALVAIVVGFFGVPPEPQIPPKYPNVFFVEAGRGEDADKTVSPLRFDGQTMPPVTMSHLSGVYQNAMFFWHDRLDKYPAFNDRSYLHVFECIAFCRALNETEGSNVYLIYKEPQEKKDMHMWYAVEMTPMDPETPLIYARTKGRKDLRLVSEILPWVDPNPEFKKPKTLPIAMYSIWDILWPGVFEPNPIKWILHIIWIVAGVMFLRKYCEENEDDDYD
ncbi:unnamed protein product [Amoebophrya sp. A25]|nr:unnamed protein product [Amoebophrya sp. A25]|eukprot:GSA25T00005013001.1